MASAGKVWKSAGKVWKKVRWSVQQRGVMGTLRLVAGRVGSSAPKPSEVGQHPFDAMHGVDTGGVIGGGNLSAGHAHDRYITAYAGVPPSRFRATIRRWLETLPLEVAESYAFIDLGCGKGRAVMLASELHFREVIGVELSPELAQVAEANLAIWTKAGKRQRPMRIVCGDATEFALPEGPCLVYLANPFGAPVMRRLLEKLEARALAGGGPVDVVYQNPEQEAVFGEFPAFRLLWSEVTPLTQEEAKVDVVFTTRDRCNGYRR